MSRARNIKPGFFKNDLLAECHPLARILFAGLWCEADREGRLEDRPKRLKVECLPYDDCDLDALLLQLSERGFITRYTVNGQPYIAINEFLKHQNPHQREVPSTIPAPSGIEHSLGDAQAQPRLDQDLVQPGSLLFPDSPSLIPDSSSEADASGVEPPSDPPADPIWGTGLAFLIRKGLEEKPARKLLGKARQAAGDVEVAAILADAEAQDISDPAPWVLAAASKAKARAGPTSAKPSIAQNFSEKTYIGTPDDELPEFLRAGTA